MKLFTIYLILSEENKLLWSLFMQKEIFVTKSSMPSLDEYIEEIKDMWNSHCLTNMGPKHIELQKKLKEYMEC